MSSLRRDQMERFDPERFGTTKLRARTRSFLRYAAGSAALVGLVMLIVLGLLPGFWSAWLAFVTVMIFVATPLIYILIANFRRK